MSRVDTSAEFRVSETLRSSSFNEPQSSKKPNVALPAAWKLTHHPREERSELSPLAGV